MGLVVSNNQSNTGSNMYGYIDSQDELQVVAELLHEQVQTTSDGNQYVFAFISGDPRNELYPGEPKLMAVTLTVGSWISISTHPSDQSDQNSQDNRNVPNE